MTKKSVGDILTPFTVDLSPIEDHLRFSMDLSSLCVFWKDKKSVYLGVNKTFSELTGLTEKDIVGKKDQDLIWAETAPTLLKNDESVLLSGTAKSFITTLTCYDEKTKKTFLGYKSPLCSRNGKIVGLFCISYMLADDNSLPDFFTKSISMLGFNPSIGLFINGDTKIKSLLSSRQMDCLYYLAKGKTAKQISGILNLSFRTVEHYLNSVKAKLKCRTRAELIEKALKIEDIKDKL